MLSSSYVLTVILEMIRQGGIDVKPQLEFACYYLEIITSSGLLNEATFQLIVLSWSSSSKVNSNNRYIVVRYRTRPIYLILWCHTVQYSASTVLDMAKHHDGNGIILYIPSLNL